MKTRKGAFDVEDLCASGFSQEDWLTASLYLLLTGRKLISTDILRTAVYLPAVVNFGSVSGGIGASCKRKEGKGRKYCLDNDQCLAHLWYVLFFLGASVIDDGDCRQITAIVDPMKAVQKRMKGKKWKRDDHRWYRARFMQQCMYR